MAVCVAVIGKENSPLNICCVNPEQVFIYKNIYFCNSSSSWLFFVFVYSLILMNKIKSVLINNSGDYKHV